jgi:hypothetical protein
MGLFHRVSQVFGLALPYKKVSWMRIAQNLIFIMSLRAKIVSMEGDRVTVAFDDGQTMTIPASACEGKPSMDAEVRLLVTVPSAEDSGRQALAKELLNEILAP